MTASGISIKKAFLWQTLRVYGPIALKSGSAFFLTAYFTPELAGSFALIWMALSLFAVPADNGIKRIALGEAAYSEVTALYWIYKNRKTALLWSILTFITGFIWSLSADSVFFFAITVTSTLYTWFYGITAPLFSLWHREKRFQKLAIFEWIGAAFGILPAWFFAVSGKPDWAILSLFSIPPLVACVAMYLSERSFFQRAHASPEPLSISISLLFSEMLISMERKLDSLLIGFFAGNTTLGLYNRSYAIVHYPQQLLQTVVNPVQEAFLRGKTDQAKASLLNTALSGISILLPMLFIVQWTASMWIPFFWGEVWLSLIPFLSILTVLSAAQWIITFLDVLWVNNARYKLRFKLKMIGFLGLGGLAVSLPLFGTMNALTVLTFFYSIQAVLSILLLFSWKAALRSFLILALMFSIAFSVHHIYPESWAKYFIICLVGLGFGAYYRFTLFELKKNGSNLSNTDL